MQQQATAAYRTIRQKTASPRELEAGLLLAAAGRLQTHREAGILRVADLVPALTYNCKLWTILMTSAMREPDRLPPGLSTVVVELGLYVIRQTAAALAGPTLTAALAPLPALIAVNRTVATGLRGSAATDGLRP